MVRQNDIVLTLRNRVMMAKSRRDFGNIEDSTIRSHLSPYFLKQLLSFLSYPHFGPKNTLSNFLLFFNPFKFTVFSTVLQLHTLLLQSFKILHKIIQKGNLVISYKGTHFQSLQFVPESFQLVCINL